MSKSSLITSIADVNVKDKSKMKLIFYIPVPNGGMIGKILRHSKTIYIIWRLKKMADITIKTDKCDNCGDCTDVCPMEVLILKDGKLTVNDPDECSYCETCVDICPNECITIE